MAHSSVRLHNPSKLLIEFRLKITSDSKLKHKETLIDAKHPRIQNLLWADSWRMFKSIEVAYIIDVYFLFGHESLC